jgi:hypothetical protein
MTAKLSQTGTYQMKATLQPIAPSMSLALIETEKTFAEHSGFKRVEMRAYYSDAGFLAHLLAVRHDSHGMRIKRRATPAQAIQAYDTAAMQGCSGTSSNIKLAA